MKLLNLVLFLSLTAMVLISCGKSSSPEGRMNAKVEALQQSIDSLKQEHKALLDSVQTLQKSITELQKK